MKIWHPDTDNLSGGVKTFMTYFDEFFKNDLVKDFKKADLIFGLNDWINTEIIKEAKTLNIKYVHRANGLYKPELINCPDWEQRNAKLAPAYNLADLVIFQSMYSLYSYFTFINKINNYVIIPNGTQKEKQKIVQGKKILLLYKGLTQKEKTLVEFAKKELKNFELINLNKFNDRKELQQQLENVGVAIDFDVQANCNNLNLEIMMLGIPVMCISSGGNPEICLNELIFTEHNLLSKIEFVLANKELFNHRLQHHINKFLIQDILTKYENEFKEVIK